MKRMILTSSSGVGLTYAHRADVVVPLIFRFVSGPLPTSHHLEGEAPFEKDEVPRYHRYRKSQVALTELGRAITAGEEDFSRHNPIHRWWGGTELTNERLWRWDPQDRSLVAP